MGQVFEQDRCVSWKGVWVGQVCEWDSCLHEWDRCVTHWDRYLSRTGVWVRQVNTVYGHLSKTPAVVGSSFTDYLYNCNSKGIKNLFGATMLHAGWALFGTSSMLINLFCTWTLSVCLCLSLCLHVSLLSVCLCVCVSVCLSFSVLTSSAWNPSFLWHVANLPKLTPLCLVHPKVTCNIGALHSYNKITVVCYVHSYRK